MINTIFKKLTNTPNKKWAWRISLPLSIASALYVGANVSVYFSSTIPVALALGWFFTFVIAHMVPEFLFGVEVCSFKGGFKSWHCEAGYITGSILGAFILGIFYYLLILLILRIYQKIKKKL